MTVLGAAVLEVTVLTVIDASSLEVDVAGDVVADCAEGVTGLPAGGSALADGSDACEHAVPARASVKIVARTRLSAIIFR
jgi:hypothetical protein